MKATRGSMIHLQVSYCCWGLDIVNDTGFEERSRESSLESTHHSEASHYSVTHITTPNRIVFVPSYHLPVLSIELHQPHLTSDEFLLSMPVFLSFLTPACVLIVLSSRQTVVEMTTSLAPHLMFYIISKSEQSMTA